MFLTKPRLRYLLFYVTSRCNLRCSHCFYLEELNKHDEMSLEEIEKVARSLAPLSFVRMTGGEPFLRKDLPEVIHAFRRHSATKRLGIITNGTRPEWVQKTVARMFELSPDVTVDVGVSVDGLQEVHDELRGLKGSFQRAKDTVAELVNAQRDYPQLLTSTVTTVTAKNEPQLEGLYDELASWGVNRLSVNHLRGKVHDQDLLEVPFARYQEFARKCEAYHQQHETGFKASVQRAKNRLAQNAIYEVVDGNDSSVHCLAGTSIGVLYSDGNVSLCEMLEGDLAQANGRPAPHALLGNVRDVDHDFYRIWHSDNTQRCREWIRETNCSCSHECFLTASILFGKENYPALAKEWVKQTLTGASTKD